MSSMGHLPFKNKPNKKKRKREGGKANGIFKYIRERLFETNPKPSRIATGKHGTMYMQVCLVPIS